MIPRDRSGLEPETKKPVKLHDLWNASGILGGSKGEAAATLLRFILGHEDLDRDDERCLVGCVSVLLDTEET